MKKTKCFSLIYNKLRWISLIDVTDLSFSYNSTSPIFDNFNFHLQNANFFGLIGVNGAGKSTFLKLCLGLLYPDKGKLLINGYNIQTERTQVLKQIGVLHENPKFPDWVVVEEYLVWLGQLRGFTKEQAIQQTNYLISKLNLEESRKKHVNQLSAGLTQRFGLSQAIIGVPSLIFLDEPTANLDVQSRYMVLELLNHIVNKFDTRIVIMSHILSDLERYCDEIAIMNEGKIVYRNSIAQIITNHSPKYFVIRNPYIQNLEEYVININLNIIQYRAQQIVIKLSANQTPEAIKDKLPDGTVINPFLSVLEQIFVEKTENHELFSEMEE